MQINPVVEKELKIKMRGWKAPALITVYLGFLGIVVLLSFLPAMLVEDYSMHTFNPRMAVGAYTALAFIQFFMIMFIMPALTGGAISSERERQTLDLLLCTNFSPLSIITGKIFVSISHIMLLISASLPIMATVFLFGGIGFTDLLFLFAFYLVTALMIASIGIFYSTVFKKSTISIVVTYITLLFLLGGTVVIFGIWAVFTFSGRNSGDPTAKDVMSFLFANPMYGFVSVLGNTENGILFDISRQISRAGGAVPKVLGLEVKPWMVNILFNVFVTVVFVLLSARKIKPLKKPLFKRK